MSRRPSSPRRAGLGIGLALAALVLAPACFRGADPAKLVCGDDAHCPSGYQCQVDPTSHQGRCTRGSSDDASGTTPTVDAPLGDRPSTGGAAGHDALSGGATGAAGMSGTGGTAGRDTESGAGGAVSSGGLTATGGRPATGGKPGAGGTVGGGGTSGLATGQGGATVLVGTGGHTATGSGGSAGCSVAGQKLCGTTCVDPQSDNANCGECGAKCDSGQRCSKGSCVCDKTSCPGGCCMGTFCIDPDAQSGAACGKPGTACLDCPSQSTCVAGDCVCDDKYTMCPGTNTCSDLQNDKDHCGTCAQSCADGCATGRCFTRLASLATSPTDMAVNATHVYFTMQNEGTVSRVSRSGGAVQVLASLQPYPMRIALDGNNVYWLTTGTGNGGTNLDGSVMKLPLTGGSAVALATMEPYPQALTVDASHVYWTNALGPGLAAGSVMKVPIAGGSKVELVSTGDYTSPRGIAVDATAVYWINMGEAAFPGSIMKVPLAGGTAAKLATVIFPVELALNGGTLYFTCWETNAGVEKLSTAGGSPEVVWSKPVDQSARIAADASSLYLAHGSTGQSALLKIDLGTGASSTVVPMAFAIALDDKNIFWADGKGINVMTKTP